ncbi:MAG: signal peptidase I [Ruminococcaceae bacterium]|nr:signal peptidase I [Oscillospiraceae bacterium]
MEITDNTDSTEVSEEQPEEPKKPFADILEWMSCMIFAVTAMLVINLFFFRSITVSGTSMNDTLVDGDKVIAMNFCYTPQYGDIVIVQANKLKNKNTGLYGEPIIKRVIAKGGDTVRIDYANGNVYRNDELLEEDYIKDLTHLHNDGWLQDNEEIVVPENCVFVMGDNRNASNDSRNLQEVGFIDVDAIMGKAIVRFAPIKSFKWL